MKNTHTFIRRIAPDLLPAQRDKILNGVKKDMQVLACTNLRPHRSRSGNIELHPCGKPAVVFSSGAWRPLCALSSKRLLTHSGVTLRVDKHDVAQLSGNPLCALSLDGDKAVVMCDNDAINLSVTTSGSAVAKSSESDFPPLRLTAIDSDTVSASVAARTLTGTYSQGDTFNATDAARLSTDLSNAYRTLCRNAAAAGRFIQPFLCRYRLLDKDLQELFISPPVLLGGKPGAQCTGGIDLYSDTAIKRINPYTLQAQCRQLVLEIPQQSLNHPRIAEIAAVEVLVSPQFHPFDPDASPDISNTRNGNSGAPVARIHLPGMSTIGVSTIFPSASQRTLSRTFARIDNIQSRAAFIRGPFNEQKSFKIDFASRIDVDSEIRAFKQELARSITSSPDKLSAMLQRPHSFSAGQVSTSADIVVWGDLHARRFKGYAIDTFVRSVANTSGSWRASIKVTFNSGKESVVWSGYGLNNIPESFNAILSYPSPDAETMTVTLWHSAKLHSLTVPLTPDESGKFAVYISPDLVAPELTVVDGLFEVPPEQVMSHRFPSAVAFARKTSPLIVERARNCAVGNILSILEAPRGNQAWEFGRARFYIGTPQGIYSARIDINRRVLSLHGLTVGGIRRHDAIIATDTGVCALVESGSGLSDLIHITPSGTNIISSRQPYEGLARVAATNELWAIRSAPPLADNEVDIFCEDFNHGRYHRTLNIAETFSVAGEAYALQPDGALLLLSSETFDSEPIRIKWSAVTDIDNGRNIRPRALRLNAEGTNIGVQLRLSRSSLHDSAIEPLAITDITGELRSSVLIPLIARPLRTLRTDITGEVSPDFILNTLCLQAAEQQSNV